MAESEVHSDFLPSCLPVLLSRINNGYGYEGSGSDIAKSVATTSGWIPSSLLGATGNDQTSNNSNGFSGSPGGYLSASGTFVNGTGYRALWWSMTVYDELNSWHY